jgi:NADH dehydrogenase (ubiquinone) 1 beta subcomplex subunit 9
MSSATASFQTAHRLYVKSLYKRSLKLSLDWYIRRDLWRQKALEIRQQFELNKNVTSPKELQQIFAKTEMQLEEFAHPDPYKCMYIVLKFCCQKIFVFHQFAPVVNISVIHSLTL